jgi:hypothetical protein
MTAMMKRRVRLALVLGLLAVAPTASHSGPVAGLTIFANGELADADEVNANFAIVESAVNDNDARITVLENLTGASCPTDNFMTGITIGATLECSP